MSLAHVGNVQPAIDREEHTHLGDQDSQRGARGIIDVGDYAVKITQSGTDTYVALAAPGTSQADNKWQCKKIDQSGAVTWAGGTPAFNQIASDLTALTYS